MTDEIVSASWPPPAPFVVRLGPGVGARLHLAALRASLRITGWLFRNRGLHRVTVLLGRVFGSRNAAVFRVFGDRELRVSLADRYWIPHLLHGRGYEPEVGYVLSRILHPGMRFVDGGANVGWWSIFASTRIPERDRILAIEASPRMFAQLEGNCVLNGNRFTCLNAALWNHSGQALSMLSHRDRHGSSSLTRRPPARGYFCEATTSVTLSDAMARHLAGGGGGIVVKLDVEGAEVEALETLPLHDLALLVYEDHGLEPGAKVSEAVMAKGLRVFHCDDSYRIREMTTIGSVREVKRNRSKGYNFFACLEGSEAHRVLAGSHEDVAKRA